MVWVGSWAAQETVFGAGCGHRQGLLREMRDLYPDVSAGEGANQEGLSQVPSGEGAGKEEPFGQDRDAVQGPRKVPAGTVRHGV